MGTVLEWNGRIGDISLSKIGDLTIVKGTTTELAREWTIRDQLIIFELLGEEGGKRNLSSTKGET